MKKSMRMVSVIMAAVMSMSAMSALAAGASAEEVNEPCPFYVIDETHSRCDVPVFIKTTGINGKLKNFSITVDYEFIANADSEEVGRIRAAHPEDVSAPDKNGFVLVKAHEKHICTENTGDNTLRFFDIPAYTDMNSLKIRLDYDSKTMGEREICKFDFASITTDDYDAPQISIHLDHDSFSSIVNSMIFVNSNLVCSKMC